MGTTPNLGIPYPENSGLVTDGAAAMEALADKVDTEVGGAWTAYVPTLSGGTIGTTGASAVGGYRRQGKTVHFWGRVVLGSGFTVGAGLAVSLPVAAKGSSNHSALWALLTDSGTANYYAIPIMTSTAVQAWVFGASGAVTGVGATTPFTWAAGDTIDVAGTYEAA